MTQMPGEIFKAYDIRGAVGRTLTPALVESVGRAVGSEARARGRGSVAVGRDGRLSSPELAAAAIRGLLAAGCDVVDIGLATTPMAYFAAYHLDTRCALMVTGSHNPPGDNGLKIVLADEALSGDAIQGLRRRIEAGDLASGRGRLGQADVTEAYIARIAGDIRLARPMKVLVDAGNGVAGAFAPALYRALGCQVAEVCCEVDGRFPHHHPDPSVPGNLADLIARLRAGEAEIGLAFDGDGDRLGVVARDGRIIFPDRLLMLFAEDVLARNPGGLILFDVKSTRNLYKWIADRGGQPMLWKTGHSVMKARMRETGALLAGEVSGHVFFKERWYGFDDGLYAGARLLEILSRRADPDAALHALPDSLSTPELHVPMLEGEPARLMDRLRAGARFSGAERVIDLDGLRAEYPDGFGLMRASNTTPVLVLRFEADDPAAMARIQAAFRSALEAARPGLSLPF